MTSKQTKGVRDLDPGQAATKQRIRDAIKDAAERHSYQAMDTPVIEARSILTSKFTGGEEILKEMYTLTDQGERDLGLRYDLTVPFARYIAEHPELKHPFKRYQHGSVFRDGPVKPGRYREFEQFDLDVVGTDSLAFDAELISIVHDVLTELGITPEIQVNTRSLLHAVITHAGIPEAKADTVILTIDKYEKIGRDGVADELSDKGLDDDTIATLLDTLSAEGSNQELIDHFADVGDVSELQQLHDLLDAHGVDYTLNPYLARGLTYYTGTIFEAFTPERDFDRSVAAGGRYDDMVAALSEHEDSLPAVGASFGVDTLLNCLGPADKPRGNDLYVIPLADHDDIIPRVDDLRRSVDVMVGDPTVSFSKHMDYADKEGFGYLLVIGDDELSSEEYTVKDLDTGEERTGSLEDVPGLIDDLQNI